MSRLKIELRFLLALFELNISSAMEYRASFITQVLGMLINNGIYFVFWVIFFDKFGTIEGYGVSDIYLLFAVVTLSYGLATLFAANVGANMAYLIAQGRLDYYLALPRPVLTHVAFSHTNISAFGDIIFAMIAFSLYGRTDWLSIVLFIVSATAGALIFSGFAVLAGSLAFFMGNAQYASSQMTNGMLTFSFYPQSLFGGMARFMLYTILPAGFIGAIPAEIIRSRDGTQLLIMLAGVVAVWAIALLTFHIGLRRYESGSALNVNV